MQIEGPPLGVDLALLGIVFALVLFILVFSAMVLYVAFRVKETFRGESRRGIVIAKVAFLIGVLFLAAGGFYFLAQVLLPRAPPVPVGPQLSLTLSYPVQVTREDRKSVV